MQTMIIPLAEGMYSRTTVEWRIAEYVRVLNAKVLLDNATRDYQADVTYYVDKPGQKFTRIIRDTGDQQFVECFVENATGKVIKAAGWKSPAKDKAGFAYRWDLMDDESRRRLFGSINGSLGASYYLGVEQSIIDQEESTLTLIG